MIFPIQKHNTRDPTHLWVERKYWRNILQSFFRIDFVSASFFQF